MIYTQKHAELLKVKAGECWQPSNTTEGMLFHEALCQFCAKNANEPCQVIQLSLYFPKYDPSYPKELVIDDNGQPMCTSFERATIKLECNECQNAVAVAVEEFTPANAVKYLQDQCPECSGPDCKTSGVHVDQNGYAIFEQEPLSCTG